MLSLPVLLKDLPDTVFAEFLARFGRGSQEMEGAPWISYCVAHKGSFLSIVSCFTSARPGLANEVESSLSLESINERTDSRAGSFKMLGYGRD